MEGQKTKTNVCFWELNWWRGWRSRGRGNLQDERKQSVGYNGNKLNAGGPFTSAVFSFLLETTRLELSEVTLPKNEQECSFAKDQGLQYPLLCSTVGSLIEAVYSTVSRGSSILTYLLRVKWSYGCVTW